MIPQEKSEAVLRGLREAFHTPDIEDIRRVNKGLSADIALRIVVDGFPYLLRIMTRINESMDPGRIFACMSAAAEAGLAPAVRYSNAEDGIVITDFLEAVGFSEMQALVHLPDVLGRLHALPPFPKAFNYVTAHNGFIWRFRKAGLLPRGELEEVFTRYDQLCAAYPRIDSEMVSCHNDLKPENILFDGQRVWLEGWHAAMVNDRYFDLAVAANFVVSSDADEVTYLDQYFCQKADEYQRARFFLMRQVVHMLAAAIFLLLGSAGKPISRTDNGLSFGDFHRRIWAGEADLADSDLKIAYGMVHWEQLLRNMRRARFDEALGIVAEENTEGVRLLLPSAS